MIQTDRETSLFNALVKSYLADNTTKLFGTHSEQKAQTATRLNRTIKGIMFRYFIKKNTRRYIDILQDIGSKYNASYHRSIKMVPKYVRTDNETQVWVDL